METAQLDRAPSANYNRFGKFCQQVKRYKKTGCDLCNLSIDFYSTDTSKVNASQDPQPYLMQSAVPH